MALMGMTPEYEKPLLGLPVSFIASRRAERSARLRRPHRAPAQWQRFWSTWLQVTTLVIAGLGQWLVQQPCVLVPVEQVASLRR